MFQSCVFNASLNCFLVELHKRNGKKKKFLIVVHLEYMLSITTNIS